MIFTCYSCKSNVTGNVYMAFDYSFCSKDCRNDYYKIKNQKKHIIKKENSIRNLKIHSINHDNENTNNYINESRNKKIINYIKNRICSREMFSIFNIFLW